MVLTRFFILSLILSFNLAQSQDVNWITIEKAQELQKINPKNIIMDIYTDWCGPCKVLTPVMENVKSKFSQVSFENVNIDTDFETAQKYYVRSVPTVIIEKNGEEVQRFVGVQSELAYTNTINENL